MKKINITILSGMPFYFRIPLMVFLAGIIISFILGFLQHNSFKKSLEKNAFSNILMNFQYIDSITENQSNENLLLVISNTGKIFPNSTITLWNNNEIIYHNNEKLLQYINLGETEYIKDFELVRTSFKKNLSKLSNSKNYYIEKNDSVFTAIYRFRNGSVIFIKSPFTYGSGIKYVISIYLSLVLLSVLFTLIVYILTFQVQKDIEEILILNEENIPSVVTENQPLPENMIDFQPDVETWKKSLNISLFSSQFQKTQAYEIASFPRNPSDNETDFQSASEIAGTLNYFIATSDAHTIESGFEKIRLQEKFRNLSMRKILFSDMLKIMNTENEKHHHHSLQYSILKLKKDTAEIHHSLGFFLFYLNMDSNTITEFKPADSYSIERMDNLNNGFFTAVSEKLLRMVDTTSEDLRKHIVNGELNNTAKGMLSKILMFIQQNAEKAGLQNKPDGIITVIKV